jgi:integrase/recombinase XerD
MRGEKLIKEYEAYLENHCKVGEDRKNRYIRSARELLLFAGTEKITEKAIKDFQMVRIASIKINSARNFTSHALRRFTGYLLKTNTLVSGGNGKKRGELERLKNEFLKACKRKGSGISTRKSIKSRLKIFYRFLGGYKINKADEITKILVIEFQNYLSTLEAEDGSPKYNVTYRCEILATVRSYLHTLYKLDYFVSDLSIWLENPKKPKKIGKNIFTVKEMRDFLTSIEPETKYEFTIKVLCVLLYGTGIRIGEAVSLKLSDINFKEKVILLHDRKAKRRRPVPFGKVVGGYLRLYIEKIRHKNAQSSLLFVWRQGKRLNDDAVGRHITRYVKKTGIEKKITSHCFRHSFCSHLLSGGLGIREIAELAGHKNLDVTAGYTRVIKDDLLEVIKKNHPREKMKGTLINE